MGRIRDDKTVVARNFDHLKELCEILADPNTSTRQLNVLYAMRTAWAVRGRLLDRELLIIRTSSTGEYTSRAAQRASRTQRVVDVKTFVESEELKAAKAEAILGFLALEAPEVFDTIPQLSARVITAVDTALTPETFPELTNVITIPDVIETPVSTSLPQRHAGVNSGNVKTPRGSK